MKPLLVLIDFQHDYLCRVGMEPSAGLVVGSAARLLTICRELRVPIVHVRTAISRSPDNRMRHWQQADRWSCEVGTAGYASPAKLVELPGEPVIHKTGFSGFAQTGLDGLLRESNVDTLLVAGVYLHACVRQTALDAYQSRLNVWIADDAVASDDPVHAAITRRYLEERAVCFAAVESLAELLRLGKPGTPTRPSDTVCPAVATASNYAAIWRGTSLDQRSGMVRRLIARLGEESRALAHSIAQETGKPVRFCRVEVERSGEMLGAILARATLSDAETSGPAFLRRRPHGTVAIITPFNNPVYLSLGKIVPAVLYGNAVAWKPAPEATQVSVRVQALLREAGWPEGLVSLIFGGRREGQALLNDSRIAAVSITGSSAAGFSAQEACARRRIPLQAELGGNNAAIIWHDANLVDAARQVASGAFDAAGQRCTANRRVILHEAIRERFVELLLAESRNLTWGDPLDESTRIGPLVSPARRDFVAGMVDRAIHQCGPPLWPHGRDIPINCGRAELWYPPTIISCDDPQQEIVQEETFGPVLVVQTVGNWQDAVDRCNGVRQGLAAAVFTRSVEVAHRFLEEAQAGILKLNRSTADAAVDVAFIGWKASGVGPPEHGAFDLDFYTRPQTVYGSAAELPDP